MSKMRTIKFRGKDEQGEWQEGDLLVQLGIHYILTPIWETYRNETVKTDRSTKHIVNSCTVGQFTGLYDKNGKEIYEGDIVKTKGGWGGVVLWNSRGYFYIKDDNYSDDEEPDLSPLGSLLCYERKQLEIIGNIYDKPEF